MRIGDDNLFEIGCRETSTYHIILRNLSSFQESSVLPSAIRTLFIHGVASIILFDSPPIASLVQDVWSYPLTTKSWMTTPSCTTSQTE
jgi:hypothetical protein